MTIDRKTLSHVIDGKTFHHEHFYSNTVTATTPVLYLIPAFDGWSDFLENYAMFFVEHGFQVVGIDFYSHRARATTLDGCFDLVRPFLNDRAAVRHRSVNIFNFLNTLFYQSPQGAMGFCFGVRCVLEMVRAGCGLKSAVGAHGLLSSDPALPCVESINTSLLMIQGYDDPMVPMSECTAFGEEMSSHGAKDWNVVFIGQARHSFTDPKTGTFDPVREEEIGRRYDRVAASRTQRWALDFFEQTLLKI